MSRTCSLLIFHGTCSLYGVLFVLVILAHERRHVVHFNVMERPTAQWTAVILPLFRCPWVVQSRNQCILQRANQGSQCPRLETSITTMNDRQREKAGDIWRLQHHTSNNAWPPWKRK
jgi:hypothetical protein